MAGPTLSKSVSLRIVANAGTAKETLDDIASKADNIDGKRSSLTVGVRSGDTQKQLDEIRAKALALGITNVKFAVKADTKTADASLTQTKTKVDSLGKSLSGAALDITGFSAAQDAANSGGNKFKLALAGINLATGVLEPVMAGAIVSVMGLASGFLAAGAGAGVFGLVLKGTIGEVTAATKAHKVLGGSLGELQRELNHTKTLWQRFIADSASGVASVLTPALKLVPPLLSMASQFLGPVEAGLQIVIANVKTALSSPFWKSTIGEWAATSGPALVNIATAIGHIIHGLAGVVTAFMPFSTSMLGTVDTLTAKFAKWGETLSSHTGFQSLLSMAQTEGPMAVKVLGNLATVLLNVGKSMTGLDGVGNSKTLLQVLTPLSGILASLSKNQDLDRIALYLLAATSAGSKLKNVLTSLSGGVSTVKDLASGISKFAGGFSNAETAASAASGAMGTFGGKLSTMVTAIKEWGIWSKVASAATKIWTGIQLAFDVVMAMNPIGLVVIGIVALIAIIVVVSLKVKSFGDFWKSVWHGITTAFDAAFQFVKRNWLLIGGILLGPITLAVALIIKNWAAISSAAGAAIRAVVGFFTALPGQIGRAISGLSSMLFNIGYNAVMGLWHGISAMIGWVVGQVQHFASQISGAFSAVLGIFSPSRVFMQHGRNIVLGLASGITGNLGVATSAVAGMGDAVSGALRVRTPAASGLAGGGGSNVFHITVQGVVGDAGATGKQIVQTINTYLRQSGQGQFANV